MRMAIIALRSRREAGQHPGLLLQRYLSENATGEGGNPGEKRAILQAAINAAADEETRALYRAAFERWSASLAADPAPTDLQTVGRLIVGLGSENVLESGIRLHHTYGMPIVPGSALKGLAAHYCDQVWGTTEAKFKKRGMYHQLFFGTTDDSGCITFHDAWLAPDSPDPLKLDVMTPHHPQWLDGSVAPTDFDSPIPVPFLSVSGTFRVAVSWHGPTSDKAKNWTELARSLLCDALKDWGIGGKITSGYGRLVDRKHAPVSSASLSGVVASPSSTGRRSGGVKVKFLGQHDKLKNAFWVQEEGKKRGLLKYGTPPTPLPAVDSEVEVYRTNDNPNAPEYRWDKPLPPRDQPRSGGRPRGGRR
jgi:CRISPR-associated protein Cmr6